VVVLRLEASFLTFMLKVKGTAAFWPKESARVGSPGDLSRAFGADTVAVAERLQEGVLGRVFFALRMP
jgi:hypothetical protein